MLHPANFLHIRYYLGKVSITGKSHRSKIFFNIRYILQEGHIVPDIFETFELVLIDNTFDLHSNYLYSDIFL